MSILTSVLTSHRSDIGLDVRPLSTSLAAEVRGVDLADISDELATELRIAFARHQILFFPELRPTPDQHVTFARLFGPLTRPSSVKPSVDGHPEITEFDSRELGEQRAVSGYRERWHVDITFAVEPPGGAVFHAVEVPAAGGDTYFASTQAAYDRLSPPWQRFLDGLVAFHEPGRNILAQADKYGQPDWEGTSVHDIPRTEHPVVIAHPVTGRPGIFVNPGFTTGIKGFSEAESRTVLDFLYAHVTQPEHTVRYRWRNGAVAVWDNRAVWHRRVVDFDELGGATRRVQRVQLKGDRPTPYATGGLV